MKKCFILLPLVLVALVLTPASAQAGGGDPESCPPNEPCMGGIVRQPVLSERYSDIASEIAGKRVIAWCWPEPFWGIAAGIWVPLNGEADIWSGQLRLAPHICAQLDLLVEGNRPRAAARRDFATAVAALAHEAVHLQGEANEALTECFALQRIESVARRLGVGPGYARKLASTYWRYVYPRMPADYRTTSCHDGGPLDLNLGPWPH